ncbi:hypothetical protein HYPSUDRAFT_386843 [Hypholoma sublateritium FD-334 SS-4]|uniref:AB hydrolase-1 domain-containing protein n=1 Tax=Hypholoma sublateritium (strain FD-334 SS-4) TaxID=945553 RepID=A0A0D2P4L1_HYPSF|nr:hypothetical protein HYPSUDRAFT_386843 [Hypholoma sublateritium FD-334 SS-4]
MSADSGHEHKTPMLRWLNPAGLADAINSALPAQPQRARLPPAFRAAHPPPFFDNLTRSTLPTASLSPPPPTLARPPPLALAPAHSSIDTLRRVHTHSAVVSIRETEAPTTLAASFSKWWFQSDASKDSLDEVKQKYLSPSNPVVFCHGLLGFDSVTIGPSIAPFEVVHWRGIKEVLEENGTEVLITRVPATSSPVDRAKVLEARISEVYPGRAVHLIGHSMFKVLSITTIATPHRGSAFADHFLSTVGRTRMPSVLSLLDLLPNGGGDGAAFECLTIESMRKFNEECPDVPGVRYFSWGAVYEPGLIDTWKWPHSVILEKEGPNDGLVSVASSKWGTYLGTLSQVNHLDLVGWVNTARYKWAEMMGKEIKFRPATFYLGIADMLAREVEGQGGAAGGAPEERMVESLDAAGADVRHAGKGAPHRRADSTPWAAAAPVVFDADAPGTPTVETRRDDAERAKKHGRGGA